LWFSLNTINSRISKDSSNPINDESVPWSPSANTWYHIAWTRSSSGIQKFYVNGSQIGTDQIDPGWLLEDSNQGLLIGKYKTGDPRYFDGKIDEVRIWNVVRTASEIADNYNKELVGNEPGLAAYYKLNNSALDETENNNDLTLVNNPVYSTDVPFA
jgi:hypothetical protein